MLEEGKVIIIREYEREDYSDLIRSGYPFGSYLKPDARNWVKNLLLSRKETKKFIWKILFPGQEEITLVAFCEEEKEAVGVVKLRKITDKLWGVWDIFVSPAYRGRRIASSLYQESLRVLKRRKAKKAVGTVVSDNIASIKSIKRNWQGFLSKRVFNCFRKRPLNKPSSTEIIVRRLRNSKEKNLFQIYRRCVGKPWCDFLEITQDNYLDRIFGMAGMEPISKSIIAKMALRKEVFIAEYEKELCGYAVSCMMQPFYAGYALHLFVPISENFEEVSKALLLKALNPLLLKKLGAFSFVYIGEAEVQDRLRELGFETRENLVAYNYL